MSKATRLHKYTLFCLLCAIVILVIPLANVRVSSQECVPPECYPEEPDPEPIPPEQPMPSVSGGSWAGYSDGRLNPAMDEYYSIWCGNDVIEVWGGVPSPQLIETIPIIDVMMGQSLTTSGGLTVSRSSDIVIISGSNGNGAAHPGSKSFSLTECLSRNGRTPEIPNPQAGAGAPQDPNTAPVQADVNSGEVPCNDLTGDAFVECITEYFQESSAEILWSWITGFFRFCAGGIVFFVPSLHILRRRMRL